MGDYSWQTKLLLVFDIAKVDYVLTKPKHVEPSNESFEEVKKKYDSENASWASTNKIQHCYSYFSFKRTFYCVLPV